MAKTKGRRGLLGALGKYMFNPRGAQQLHIDELLINIAGGTIVAGDATFNVGPGRMKLYSSCDLACLTRTTELTLLLEITDARARATPGFVSYTIDYIGRGHSSTNHAEKLLNLISGELQGLLSWAACNDDLKLALRRIHEAVGEGYLVQRDDFFKVVASYRETRRILGGLFLSGTFILEGVLFFGAHNTPVADFYRTPKPTDFDISIHADLRRLGSQGGDEHAAAARLRRLVEEHLGRVSWQSISPDLHLLELRTSVRNVSVGEFYSLAVRFLREAKELVGEVQEGVETDSTLQPS